MQKSDEISMSKSSHRKMRASTTLSRKYTKRPSMGSEIKIPKSLKINRFSSDETNMNEQTMEKMTENSSKSMSRMIHPNDQMGMGEMIYDNSNMSMEEAIQSNASMNMTAMMRNDSLINEEAVYAPETMPVYPDYPDYPEEPNQPHSMRESTNIAMKESTKMRQMSHTTKSSRSSTLSGVTAEEMKEQAIKNAMSSASKVHNTKDKKTKKSKKVTGVHFGFGRVVLALTCASVAVMAIVYFVNLNMPDISLSVAAIQNGMNVSYPSYIPRDYSVSSVTSETGKVTIVFDNSSENKTFSLIEEGSSWDSNALLANYVKGEYGENYTVVREQGLTLFVSGSNAAWVNGGNVYKIIASNGTLTNKQIRSIAVSL